MKSFLTSLIKKYQSEVDYLEIRVEEFDSTSISFKGPSINSLHQVTEKGGCIRALHKGGWGFATFNNLDEANVSEFIKSAIRQAKMVGKKVSKLAEVPVVDATVKLDVVNDPRDVPLSRKVEILENYNQIILRQSEYIPMSSVAYSDKYRRTWFANSDGSFVDQEHIDLGGGLVPIAVKDGQTQMASVGFGSSRDFNVILGLEDQLVTSCQNAVELLDAPTIKGGMYTVIADSKLAGVFVHEAFGHTSEGEKVFDNKKLAEIMKFGEVFGSPILNIYDTGLDKGVRGELVYDDEGVRTEKTYLIENGKLVGRLHNRETAGKMNERATGNGRALNYKFPPIPRMRNTCIEQGTSTLDDMIKDIKLGVYAVDALGGQGGEMFSFTAGRGYMIRDGKVEEMIKNVTLSGNLFVTLKNIDAIGNDFAIHDSGGGCGKGAQFPMAVSSGSPSIRIQNVVVGGN